MEAQAEAAAPAAVESFSPEMIGNAFVSQFYSILHQTPELVHRFYQDTSTMSRPARDGSLTTVTTMKEISELIVSLDCKEYKAEIKTADTQPSHKEGVIVLVTGCLTGKDNVRRKFTETFFLAPQSNGYYVLNDAFRFIAEDEVPVATAVEVKEADVNVAASTVIVAEEPAAEPVIEVTEQSMTNITAAVIEPASNGNIDVCNKPDEPVIVKESVIAEPLVEVAKPIDDYVVVESSDVQDTPKKSYASIIKDMKEKMLTTLASPPSTTKKNLATSNGKQTNGTTASVPKPQANGTVPSGQQLKEPANSTSVPESSAPNGNARHGNSSDKTEEKGYSIYIGNLPFDATVEHVEKEFKTFGPIKNGGIQVRCSKGFCFGFVEYESYSSVQKALEASVILVGGYEAFIEEKKTSTRVVNGVPTFSSGRGGYRNDGFRGRGNFSGGRGLGRNDYARRGDYGNGARNGEYGNGARNGDYRNGNGARNGEYGGRDHGGYQNGGGRGVRQGGSK